MRIFRLADPFDYHFAEAGRLGTWHPDPGLGVCPRCKASRQERVSPLIIEWLPGSDVIGDFTWAAIGELLVSQEVGEVLKKRFLGVELKPIEMQQDPKLQPPKRITKRTKPRVWLPTKVHFYEFCATTWIHADADRSSLQLIDDCPVCGRKAYKVTGIEERTSRWDPIQKGLIKIHTPRVPRKGIYVDSRSLQDVDIFRLFECPAWLFCTEKVKAFIEEERFTNISLLEMGDVLE